VKSILDKVKSCTYNRDLSLIQHAMTFITKASQEKKNPAVSNIHTQQLDKSQDQGEENRSLTLWPTDFASYSLKRTICGLQFQRMKEKTPKVSGK